ncbi:MAG TPA: acylphosphatase [Dissulfurispiraceae bacterium]|nr:acylphosphatase [Dissulfurispiraceae bacterium]
MKTRVHLLIKGRVQGVGFRWFVNDIATSMGLAGWAKNLRDGRVEAVFEGEKSAIESAISHCNEGPRSAIVAGIDLSWDEQPEGLSGFDIRY